MRPEDRPVKVIREIKPHGSVHHLACQGCGWFLPGRPVFIDALPYCSRDCEERTREGDAEERE